VRQLQAELSETSVAVEEPSVALFDAAVGGAGDVGARAGGGGVGGFVPGFGAGCGGVEVGVCEVDCCCVSWGSLSQVKFLGGS
jgi:hypothetical protein